MPDTNAPGELPSDLEPPPGRDRLGRAHQMRVDIAIALSLMPAWIKRALVDRDAQRARGARAETVERVAGAIERRFLVTWHGSSDADENALAPDRAAPLFGGAQTSPSDGEPEECADAPTETIDGGDDCAEHKANF